MKYFFHFAGYVEIEADSKESAENELIALDQFALADNFTDFYVTEEDGVKHSYPLKKPLN